MISMIQYIIISLLNGNEYYINKADANPDIDTISHLLKGARIYKNKRALTVRDDNISSKKLNIMNMVVINASPRKRGNTAELC